MSEAAKSYDEDLINYFHEQLVSHADTLYRFAFGVTLSLDGAAHCVRRTYEQAAAKLDRLAGTRDPALCLALLVNICWGTCKALESNSFTRGQSAVTKALDTLDVAARAALAAVDVCGLTPADAARAFETDEKQLRMQLAKARRALMQSALA